MPKKVERSSDYQTRPCSFDLARAGLANADPCKCVPDVSAALCHCTGLNNGWSRNSLPDRSHVPHQANLVAYIRLCAEQLKRNEQVQLIDAYCAQHGFRIAQTFMDEGKPSRGLQDALQAVEERDGLIAVNLNCFVEHADDRLRDLRPFIHHFFCNKSKHLITIQEGIDTGSASGQLTAMELASQNKELF